MLYHIARGSVDYTIVGSPTIVDNVLTDITANDYLSIGTYSGDTPTSIEIGASFKTSDTTVFGNSVIGRLTGADTGIFWGNSSFPGRICFKHRVSYDNGTTWTAVESKSAVLSLNTRYYVKFIISLAEQKLTGYVSTDNTNWTSYVANFNSGAILEGLTSIAIGKIFGHNASPLPIYLDYTYIKVNGKPWFGICPIEVKKHQIMGPVGYTVVGSPTITDGVASGFSDSKYLTVSPVFPDLNGKNIEVVLKAAKIEGTSAGARAMLWSHSFTIDVTNGNALRARIWTKKTGENSYTERLLFNYAFSIAGDYPKFYKFSKDGQTLSLEGSPDGETYTSGHTYVLEEGEELRVTTAILLFKSDNWANIPAELFLNNTYIKINGKLWFWQPQETKRIVVNGVEVWTKPE